MLGWVGVSMLQQEFSVLYIDSLIRHDCFYTMQCKMPGSEVLTMFGVGNYMELYVIMTRVTWCKAIHCNK